MQAACLSLCVSGEFSSIEYSLLPSFALLFLRNTYRSNASVSKIELLFIMGLTDWYIPGKFNIIMKFFLSMSSDAFDRFEKKSLRDNSKS